MGEISQCINRGKNMERIVRCGNYGCRIINFSPGIECRNYGYRIINFSPGIECRNYGYRIINFSPGIEYGKNCPLWKSWG